MTDGPVDLHDYLSTLEHRARQTNQDTTAPVTGAILDATAEVLAGLSAGRGPVVGVWPSQLPDWLRLGHMAEFARWCHGTSDTCVHEPRAGDDWDPGVAAASRPGAVVCLECVGLIDRGTQCDCCGWSDGPLESLTVVLGALGYLVRVCDECGIDGLNDGDVAVIGRART